jgi:hypothetical protein
MSWRRSNRKLERRLAHERRLWLIQQRRLFVESTVCGGRIEERSSQAVNDEQFQQSQHPSSSVSQPPLIFQQPPLLNQPQPPLEIAHRSPLEMNVPRSVHRIPYSPRTKPFAESAWAEGPPRNPA